MLRVLPLAFLLLACADTPTTIDAPNADQPTDSAPAVEDTASDDTACEPVAWYLDADGDGYAGPDDPTWACASPGGGWLTQADPADCNDGDPTLFPEADGTCPLGRTCAEILAAGLDDGSGVAVIDPDGSGGGADPFAVSCDQTTDGGGWTLVLHLADLSGFQEDAFIAQFGHNLYTDESWTWRSGVGDLEPGLPDGLIRLVSQGAVDSALMAGLWDDLRMTCDPSSLSPTEVAFAQVDGYATANGGWALLGAAANGTAYAVDPAKNSAGLSTIWHDNETTTLNSHHYLCGDGAYAAESEHPYGGAQFGFCYTDHVNDPNSSDQGDAIVSLSFGTDYGADAWSEGFTGECGDMGTTALQNSGTWSIWVR